MSGAAISSMIAESRSLPQKSVNQRTTTALLASTDMESPSWWGNRRGGGGGGTVRSRPHLINATAAEYVSSLDRLPLRAGRAQRTGTLGGRHRGGACSGGYGSLMPAGTNATAPRRA